VTFLDFEKSLNTYSRTLPIPRTDGLVARRSWPRWLVTHCTKTVARTSTNRARRGATSLIETSTLLLYAKPRVVSELFNVE